MFLTNKIIRARLITDYDKGEITVIMFLLINNPLSIGIIWISFKHISPLRPFAWQSTDNRIRPWWSHLKTIQIMHLDAKQFPVFLKYLIKVIGQAGVQRKSNYISLIFIIFFIFIIFSHEFQHTFQDGGRLFSNYFRVSRESGRLYQIIFIFIWIANQ